MAPAPSLHAVARLTAPGIRLCSSLSVKHSRHRERPCLPNLSPGLFLLLIWIFHATKSGNTLTCGRWRYFYGSARSLGVTVDDMIMRPSWCVHKKNVQGRVYATPVKARYPTRSEASSLNTVPNFIDHYGCYLDHTLAGFQLDCRRLCRSTGCVALRERMRKPPFMEFRREQDRGLC